MISIFVADNKDYFKWQVQLFWFAHQSIYGDRANEKALAVIMDKDGSSGPIKDTNWNISISKHSGINFGDYLNLENAAGGLKTINIQVGLKQVIDRFDDEEIIEVLDCDMFHLKAYPNYEIGDDEVIVCDLYEDWHMKSLSNNQHVIEPYFLNDGKYYNGGFVPLVAKAKTFRKLLDDWISIHLDIFNQQEDELIRWWAGMYSFCAACERHKVQMIAKDCCYIPSANNFEDSQYICHYSVDSVFNKNRVNDNLNNIDTSIFPSNPFYDTIKKWLEVRDNTI